MNPYTLAKIFEANIVYVDESFKRYKHTDYPAEGFYWLIEKYGWHYFDSNTETVSRLKEELQY